MKHVCQILLLMMPLFCSGQERTIDSLKRLLPTARTDSARYSLTYSIGDEYSNIHYDSALYYLNKAEFLARKNGKKLNEAAALYYKGFVLISLQRLPECFQTLTTALQIAEDPRNEHSFWNTMKPEVKDDDYHFKTLSKIHEALGLLLQNAGRADQTVFHYKQAIKFSTLIGDSSGIASINASLGYLYVKDLNNPDSALLFEKTAANIFLHQKMYPVLGSVYAVMGGSYFKLHNDSLGLAYVHKAIAINKKYNIQDILTASYAILAKYYLQKQNKDSSLYYARLAAYIHIAAHSVYLGDVFDNLANSYELNNKLDSAYKYKKIALTTYDSLYQVRIQGLTGFQQLSFEQQQQLQKLEAQKTAAQNRTRMYTLFAGLGLAILISFFLYRNTQQQKKANMLLQQQKNETEQQKLKAESALAELKATQAQLIQSEKMASLGELTAGIAHEIQNPLNFINNFSEINTELIEELEQEAHSGNIDEVKLIANDIKENEQKINHHGKRADAIVKGMLQHSRANAGKKELTDINALSDEYLRLSYHGLRAKDKDFNVNFKTDFDESIGKIEVVPQDIGRVLLNLFNNAFYAVNEKKKQLNGSFDPAVTVSTKRTGDKVEIVVKDNGSGIPQKVVDKIFQPFFTTKPTGQGTGLGLSLSYDIVKANGGELKVKTEEGNGAEFIIQLPTADNS